MAVRNGFGWISVFLLCKFPNDVIVVRTIGFCAGRSRPVSLLLALSTNAY
jgi:hypothetical protein